VISSATPPGDLRKHPYMTEREGTMAKPCSTDPADLKSVASVDSAATLASILDRYMADLRAGIAPDRARLIDAHPELAAQLDACLAGIEFIHKATRSAPEAPTELGEFRIIRELGRGGMGVVYEAEQTTLQPWDHLRLPAESSARGRGQWNEVDRPRPGDRPGARPCDRPGLRAGSVDSTRRS
jgi:hypothetical protein